MTYSEEILKVELKKSLFKAIKINNPKKETKLNINAEVRYRLNSECFILKKTTFKAPLIFTLINGNRIKTKTSSNANLPYSAILKWFVRIGTKRKGTREISALTAP